MATAQTTGSSDAWQASVQVLTDPSLWRCITAFQLGIPMSLYEFWVAHDPAVAHSIDDELIANGIQHLLHLVVNHGTLQQLDVLSTVRYRSQYTDRDSIPMAVDLRAVGQQAIEANRVDVLEWAIARNTGFNSLWVAWLSAINHCRDGDIRVLDLLRVHKPIAAEKLTKYTHRINDEKLVRWLDLHLPGSVSERLICHAASTGNLRLVWYLLANPHDREFSRDAFQEAFNNGHYSVLQCLVELGPTEMDRRLAERIINTGPKEATQILADAGRFEDVAYEIAAYHVDRGHTGKVKRLLERGLLPSGSSFSIDRAASGGLLAVIQFLTERNLVTATTEAMDAAAEKKLWDMAMYLHQHHPAGCTTRLLDAAAAQGRLSEVRFFHENRLEGCTTRAMDEAAGIGALSVIQYLHENRSEGCTSRAMDAAAANGHREVVMFLHENRSEGSISSAVDEAAANGRLEVVEYLHENRSGGCTTNAMDLAAANGHLAVVQYLHANCSKGCTEAAVKDAVKRGRAEVVRFLYEHYRSMFGLELLLDLSLYGPFDVWEDLRAANPGKPSAPFEVMKV